MNGASRFDELVFMDDFFRSPVNGLEAQTPNRRFLLRTMGMAAGRLGIPCREVCAATDGGALDVAAMMKALALPCTPSGWAMASSGSLQSLSDIGLLPRFQPATLVIGWGMPPALLAWIDGDGASFVDLEISPVRFGSHLALCARTNDRLIEQALETWRIDDEANWNEAAIVAGYFSRRGNSAVFDPRLSVGLFCGQTTIDLALIRDGQIARPTDFTREVQALASTVDFLLFKPHPYEQQFGRLGSLADLIPNAVRTQENIYAILCADNLAFVTALSSGTLQEARYFGKTASALMTADRNNRERLPPNCCDWIQIGPDALSRQGLAWICHDPSRVHAPAPIDMPRGGLERAFGMRWGLDDQASGLKKLPTLDFAKRHGFSGNDDATAWLTFGWGMPEASGTWTVGERASLVVRLGDNLPVDVRSHLRIDGELFTGTSKPCPRVRAWIQGDAEGAQVADAPVNGTAIHFELPFSPSRADGVRIVVVEFEISGAKRPSDCGISDDRRALGLRIQGLSLEAATERLQPAPSTAQPSQPGASSAVPNPTPRPAPLLATAGLALVLACIGMLANSWIHQSEPVATARLGDLKQRVAERVQLIRGNVQSLLGRHQI